MSVGNVGGGGGGGGRKAVPGGACTGRVLWLRPKVGGGFATVVGLLWQVRLHCMMMPNCPLKKAGLVQAALWLCLAVSRSKRTKLGSGCPQVLMGG